MNRRDFVGGLVAALALDPERLLWTPDAKKIFIPAIVRPRDLYVLSVVDVAANTVGIRDAGGELHFVKLADASQWRVGDVVAF